MQPFFMDGLGMDGVKLGEYVFRCDRWRQRAPKESLTYVITLTSRKGV
jgi:hypothetical protein